jgi:Rrf2 family protein
MRPSAKAEYACLAMLELARRGVDSSPVRIREIAEPHGIPEGFLVQILLQLKGAGLVHSVRGATGGYLLARSAADVTLLEVLRLIEGPAPESPEPTRPVQRLLHDVWREAGEAQEAVLASTTLADLLERSAAHEWVI